MKSGLILPLSVSVDPVLLIRFVQTVSGLGGSCGPRRCCCKGLAEGQNGYVGGSIPRIEFLHQKSA